MPAHALGCGRASSGCSTAQRAAAGSSPAPWRSVLPRCLHAPGRRRAVHVAGAPASVLTASQSRCVRGSLLDSKVVSMLRAGAEGHSSPARRGLPTERPCCVHGRGGGRRGRAGGPVGARVHGAAAARGGRGACRSRAARRGGLERLRRPPAAHAAAGPALAAAGQPHHLPRHAGAQRAHQAALACLFAASVPSRGAALAPMQGPALLSCTSFPEPRAELLHKVARRRGGPGSLTRVPGARRSSCLR